MSHPMSHPMSGPMYHPKYHLMSHPIYKPTLDQRMRSTKVKTNRYVEHCKTLTGLKQTVIFPAKREECSNYRFSPGDARRRKRDILSTGADWLLCEAPSQSLSTLDRGLVSPWCHQPGLRHAEECRRRGTVVLARKLIVGLRKTSKKKNWKKWDFDP